MIQAEHLYKKYGLNTVVSDVSFSVGKGESLGFIGPNGAGKSTTMKMLCGVLPVYRGRVLLNGVDISRDTRKAKDLIGYLPENAPLPPNMTVIDFLKYVAEIRGITRKDMQNALDLAIQRCSLKSVLHDEIDELSKGFKRRVCLAQAILHNPPVLILDEPTDGLDPNQKREIRNLIQMLRRDTAVIISTHILEEISSVCTRVLLLSGGRMVFDGSTEEFMLQEEKFRTYTIQLAQRDLPQAAAVLEKAFPGLVKINGCHIIIPAQFLPGSSGQEKTDAVKNILNPLGISFAEEEIRRATPDDVFAGLTARSNVSPATETETMPGKTAEPENNVSATPIDGEDDDD